MFYEEEIPCAKVLRQKELTVLQLTWGTELGTFFSCAKMCLETSVKGGGSRLEGQCPSIRASN